MYLFKKIAQTFIYVLAGSTICTTIFITLLIPELEFTILLLWQVIGMSAVCSLGDVFFASKNEPHKRQMKIRMILHYLYINCVVIGGGFFMGWLEQGIIRGVIVMFLLVAVVYAGVMIALFRQGELDAEYLNQRLRKNYPTDEEREDK